MTALAEEPRRQVRASSPYAAAVCVVGDPDGTRYDPDDWFKWLESGIDPVTGEPKGGRPDAATLRRREEVKQRCRRCPALAACRRDFWDQPFGIIAGTDPEQRGFNRSPSHRRLAVVPAP